MTENLTLSHDAGVTNHEQQRTVTCSLGGEGNRCSGDKSAVIAHEKRKGSGGQYQTDTATERNKRRTGHKPRDMPRRALTSYNFFFQEQRRIILRERKKKGKNQVKFSPGTMARIVSQRWKEILPEELEKYKELATADLQRYCREMETYQEGLERKYGHSTDATGSIKNEVPTEAHPTMHSSKQICSEAEESKPSLLWNRSSVSCRLNKLDRCSEIQDSGKNLRQFGHSPNAALFHATERHLDLQSRLNLAFQPQCTSPTVIASTNNGFNVKLTNPISFLSPVQVQQHAGRVPDCYAQSSDQACARLTLPKSSGSSLSSLPSLTVERYMLEILKEKIIARSMPRQSLLAGGERASFGRVAVPFLQGQIIPTASEGLAPQRQRLISFQQCQNGFVPFNPNLSKPGDRQVAQFSKRLEI